MPEISKIDDKYPDCFRTHELCMKCPSFGASCIEKINDLDYQYYILYGW